MSAGRAAALDAEEVVARVSSNTLRGLTSQDAAARLVADGANTLAEDEEEPWWRKVLEQFEDTSLRLLLASAVVSALLGRWDDAISIAAAIALVTAVATVQELHSDAAVASLRRLAPSKCRVLRDGHAQEVLAAIDELSKKGGAKKVSVKPAPKTKKAPAKKAIATKSAVKRGAKTKSARAAAPKQAARKATGARSAKKATKKK
jgi:hypothetical protein